MDAYDTNFDTYKIIYGENESDVQNSEGNITILDDSDISELSNVNSTAAFPTGFLPVDPLKITSDIDCPRNCLADI